MKEQSEELLKLAIQERKKLDIKIDKIKYGGLHKVDVKTERLYLSDLISALDAFINHFPIKLVK